MVDKIFIEDFEDHACRCWNFANLNLAVLGIYLFGVSTVFIILVLRASLVSLESLQSHYNRIMNHLQNTGP